MIFFIKPACSFCRRGSFISVILLIVTPSRTFMVTERALYLYSCCSSLKDQFSWMSASLLIFIYHVDYMYLSRYSIYSILNLSKFCIYLINTCCFSTSLLFCFVIVYFILYRFDGCVLMSKVTIAGVISASFSGVCKLNNSSK